MSIIWAVGPTNAPYIDPNGRIAIKRDLDAVAQACEHAMKAQLGEMVLQTNQGVPYFQTVWSQPMLAQFEAAARRTLLSVANVTEVAAFTVNASAGTLSYTAFIVTTYGRATINGNV